MFSSIQHVGYLVRDLDAATAWFEAGFGAKRAGGSPLNPSYPVPTGGRNAYLRFGQVEVEIIEPQDRAALPRDTLVMHHVGYVVADIRRAMAELAVRGFKFAAESPFTNVLGQQVLYFDAKTTNGVLVHLTQLPEGASNTGLSGGLPVEKIIHAGYLVGDLEGAIAWYVDNLGGVNLGGGSSPRGGRNAFVNFGEVQVELIKPADGSRLPPVGHAMDHVGYVVLDIAAAAAECRARGFKFAADAAATNAIGQKVLYFDIATSMGTRMHLTELPG